jgi:putative inorganic carbon (HCO3(-)) transporter
MANPWGEEQTGAAALPSAHSPASQRDRWAFVFLVAFGVVVYTIPSAWIEGLIWLRPALVTSALAAGLMALRRIGKAEPFILDGRRGFALIGFVALCVASTAWSIAPEVSRETGIELVKLAAIYFTLVNVVTTPKRLMIFCGALVVASMVTSVGVIQWYLGGEDLVEGYRGRWHGVYADPNHMAMDVGLIVPIAVAFVGRRQNPMWFRAVCVIAAALAVTAVVFSHSRGGFIGLCVGMVIWALRENRRLKSLLLAGAFGIGLLIFAPSSFWERNETVTTFEQDASAMGRVHAWEVAAGISQDHPLIGVGAGGFRYAWPLYAPPEATTAFVAHNIFLDVVAEVGWIGMLLFMVFMASAIGGVFFAGRHPEIGWLARGLAAASALYLTCDLFSGYILSAHLYMLCGLAACAARIAFATQPAEEPVPGRAYPAQTLGLPEGGAA